nr:DUF4388 domain-containing protein [uncultured Holophaga sp.]
MSHLRGSLQSIALADVLQLLHFNRKSGRLFVSQDRVKGILFVRKGEVVHAEMGSLSGERAAFEIIQWEQGFFEFSTQAFTSPTTIQRSLTDLLMEGARTTDTRKRFKSLFPNLDAVPWTPLAGDALTRDLRLFPEDHRVIPHLDGFRSFNDIIRNSGEGDVTVFQTCMILREAGRLEVIEPERELKVIPQKTSLFRKIQHVLLPADLEAWWSSQGPYQNRPIQKIRLEWEGKRWQIPAQFECMDDDKTVAVPRDVMQACGITEGSVVRVCPAP